MKDALQEMVNVTKTTKRVLTIEYGVLDVPLPDISEVLRMFNQLLETEEPLKRRVLLTKIDDFVRDYYRRLNNIAKRFGLPAHPLPDFFEYPTEPVEVTRKAYARSPPRTTIASPPKRALSPPRPRRSEPLSNLGYENRPSSIGSPPKTGVINSPMRRTTGMNSPPKSGRSLFQTPARSPPPTYSSPMKSSKGRIPESYVQPGEAVPITVVNRTNQRHDARLIGAIGDGSCFFHSMCTAIDYIYRLADRVGKRAIAQILRTSIADALDSPSPDGRGDLYDAIGDGLFKNAQAAGDLNGREEYLQKLKKSCEYVGNEIYMPTSYVTGLNIIILYEEDGYAVPHIGMRRSNVTPPNPDWSVDCDIQGIACEEATVIILYRKKHYELVAPPSGGYIWDARNPFVRSLF